MTNREQLGLVPDPDFCVVLAEHKFPQKTKFYWAASPLITENQEDIWFLLTADELDAANLSPGNGLCFAAPVSEDFMRLCPPQYFVTFARFGFIFVDIIKTTITKEEAEGEKPAAIGISFFRVKEADANTAANCWAKGLLYLLLKQIMAFSAPKEHIEAAEKD